MSVYNTIAHVLRHFTLNYVHPNVYANITNLKKAPLDSILCILSKNRRLYYVYEGPYEVREIHSIRPQTNPPKHRTHQTNNHRNTMLMIGLKLQLVDVDKPTIDAFTHSLMMTSIVVLAIMTVRACNTVLDGVTAMGRGIYKAGRHLALNPQIRRTLPAFLRGTPPWKGTIPQWLLQQQMTGDVGILETTETMKRAMLEHQATTTLIQGIWETGQNYYSQVHATTRPPR